MPNRKQLILSAIFVAIVLFIVILIYRSSIYSYDVTSDYNYDFSKTNAKIINLDLKNGKVTLKKLDNTNKTAFLRINVRTTFIGRYFQPDIKIISGRLSFTEYIEHGAKGIRYINISQIISQGKSDIRFEGNHVLIDDQVVRLVLFQNQDIKKAKILVLAPHPDDAEIAAFGLYSDAPKSFILTVTAGDAGGDQYGAVYPNKVRAYLKKGELRTWNSITVPLLGGIPPEQCVNLGFFDGTLSTMYGNQSQSVTGLYTHTADINTFRKQNISSLAAGLPGGVTWRSLVNNIRYILGQVKPDIIVAPYPALDVHYDHKFSSIALFQAIKESGMQKGNLYLYSNHYVLNEHYPYGSSGGTISLPPHFGGPIFFDSIYSHPLSLAKQKDKVFALEAMNDLRIDTGWRSLSAVIKIAIRKCKKDILGTGTSYYRRAVRSNELFFIIKISDIYNEQKMKRIIGAL